MERQRVYIHFGPRVHGPVKRDITGAISRAGNTLAVWPDRVTILAIRDIRLKHHRLVNQSSLTASANRPPSISSRDLLQPRPFVHSSRLIELKQAIYRVLLENVILSRSVWPRIERSHRVFPRFKDNRAQLIEVEVARYGVIRYQHRYR